MLWVAEGAGLGVNALQEGFLGLFGVAAIWEFRKIRGAFWGLPRMRIIACGVYVGAPPF